MALLQVRQIRSCYHIIGMVHSKLRHPTIPSFAIYSTSSRPVIFHIPKLNRNVSEACPRRPSRPLPMYPAEEWSCRYLCLILTVRCLLNRRLRLPPPPLFPLPSDTVILSLRFQFIFYGQVIKLLRSFLALFISAGFLYISLCLRLPILR